jgi:hypothetical protein
MQLTNLMAEGMVDRLKEYYLKNPDDSYLCEIYKGQYKVGCLGLTDCDWSLTHNTLDEKCLYVQGYREIVPVDRLISIYRLPR